MRIIDERTGAVGGTVSTPEEALLALSGDSEERLARGLRYVWDYVHPDDATTDGAGEGHSDGERRSVRDAAKQRGGVLGAALGADGGRPGRLLRTWTLRFDPFTEANASEWPRAVSALRGQPALAEATLGELAAHLNADLRGDLAALLGRCADYVAPDDDGFGRRDEAPQTVWDRFRADSDLYELTVQEAAAAISGGPARWDALDEWTPAGGVDGDPYAVCRYAWGPLGARVQLTAAELLERYLAGDADLSLFRMVADYGEGPTEFIWPDQPRTCCGQQSGCGGDAAPVRIRNWGRPGVDLSAHGRYCGVCGAGRYFGLLTKRPLGSDETAPLGESEPVDALPPATLRAIASDGADAVACDLRR